MALLALLALTSACVPDLPLSDAGCPCTGAYHCCPIENTCLPLGATCPLSQNCPLPPAAANVLMLGSTDLTDPTPNFIPLDAAGTLTLVRGPQAGGGYLIWTQLELLGIDPAPGLSITSYLFDPDDTVRTRETALRYQVDQPSLYCDANQVFLLLDPPRIGVCPSLRPGQAMCDRDLVLRTEVLDQPSAAAGAPPRVGERTIHPLCPDDGNCSTSTVYGCAAP